MALPSLDGSEPPWTRDHNFERSTPCPAGPWGNVQPWIALIEIIRSLAPFPETEKRAHVKEVNGAIPKANAGGDARRHSGRLIHDVKERLAFTPAGEPSAEPEA